LGAPAQPAPPEPETDLVFEPELEPEDSRTDAHAESDRVLVRDPDVEQLDLF
jgi:hypothetical protein